VPERLADEQVRGFAREVAPTAEQGAHGRHEFLGRARLRQVAARARAQHVDRVLPFREAAEDQHRQRARRHPQVPQQFEPAAARQRQVEDQQVDRALPEHRLRGVGVAAFEHVGVHVAFAQHAREARARERVVVDDQNPLARHRGPSLTGRSLPRAQRSAL
jgi:hypothetical protein